MVQQSAPTKESFDVGREAVVIGAGTLLQIAERIPVKMSEGPDLLTSLPTMVARHMLGFIGDSQSLLRLERTCRTLRDLMRDGETWTESVICRKDVEFEWTTSSYRERICVLDTLRCVRKAQKSGRQESSPNIILNCFGGADGIDLFPFAG